jgi:hypothetical protein
MVTSTFTAVDRSLSGADTRDDSAASGVAWGAIFAGAAAAAALSLILLILGTGLGLSAASPWTTTTSKAATIGVAGIVWIALTQIVASALGGYLAGRLRVKWANVHGDEVYFRDTAHGLLAWAVATLVTAALLTSAMGSVLGSVTQAGGEVAKGAMSAVGGAGKAAGGMASGDGGPALYDVDSLFRSDNPVADPMDAQSRSEVGRILANGLRTGNLNTDDRHYLGTVVARRTGLAPADADRRVDDTFNRITKAKTDAEATAKQAADTARKGAEYAALWTFVALLCGAFFASLAAMFGGRRRDL